MSRIKVSYVVSEEKTSVISINKSCKVKDVLAQIQNKEKDKDYVHLFTSDGAELDPEDDFIDYYDTTTIFIATKTTEIPKDLLNNLDTEEEDGITISRREALDEEEDFIAPEPYDPKPKKKPKRDSDDDIDEFVPPEPVDPKPVSNPKKKTAKGKFTIKTSLTLDSMLKGHQIDGIDEKTTVEDAKKAILKWIKSEKSFNAVIEDKTNLEVHLYLPGGLPFLSDTFEDWANSVDTMLNKTLYAVVTRKLGKSAKITIKTVCNCSNDEMKLLLSPICDSTEEGYTQIASLLGFFYYAGSLPISESLLRNLATMTGFPPLINSLYTVMVGKKVNGLMVASITAALQTFITEKVVGSNLRTAFSYTFSLMSYVNSVKVNNLPVPNLTTYSYKDDEKDLDETQTYLKKHGHHNFVVLWDIDFKFNEKGAFKVSKIPKPAKVEQLNNCLKSEMILKPVSPLTILYLHSVSFIRTQKAKANSVTKVGLFLRKMPKEGKENNVLFIDPEIGKIEELDYEEFAGRIGDRSIDENIKSKGDSSLQQVIMVCLDTSLSMKYLLNHKSKRKGSKEKIRKELAILFLKSLMKRIHDFQIPTARGLLLFGLTTEVKCPLQIAEKDFNKEIGNFSPYGETPLWNAIDMAADEIIEFNPSRMEGGEKKFKYPKAINRIILISDADDNQSESNAKYNITEKLVQNGIVMDVILISTVEECRDALISAKITGGLSFRPQSEEEGIEIFENEAFIDIKARSDLIPFEDYITEDVFRQFDALIGKNPYTAAKDIKNRFVKQVTTKSELSSIPYTLYFRSFKCQPKSICDRYILLQINRIKKKPDENIKVYVFQNDLKKWRVFIKGPAGSPYKDVWWNLYMNFPPNYPNSPPQLRYVSIPYHQNVTPEGLVFFGGVAESYEPKHKMPSFLKEIRNLFEKPDDAHSIRRSVYDEIKAGRDSFNVKVDACVKAFAKRDYHDYLKDVKVNEDIPEVVVDEINDTNFLYVTATDHAKDEEARRLKDSDDDDMNGIDM